MARRRKHEDHVNHEARAIPYGDLVTLLLAFFVVMYSLSTVNEGKYRVLSDSMMAAFRSAPRSLDPIQIGELSKAFHEVQLDQPRTLVPFETENFGNEILEPGWGVLRAVEASADDEAAEELIADLHRQIMAELDTLIEEDLVILRQNRQWLEIEINTSVLFPTASADLSVESEQIVRRLGGILAEAPARIQVEGHTDARPINNLIFPSNWELSAARAASVVRLFAGAGVAPEEMAAVGFGEFRPTAENTTESGRNQNRRVKIVVMSGRERHLHQGLLNQVAGP